MTAEQEQPTNEPEIDEYARSAEANENLRQRRITRSLVDEHIGAFPEADREAIREAFAELDKDDAPSQIHPAARQILMDRVNVQRGRAQVPWYELPEREQTNALIAMSDDEYREALRMMTVLPQVSRVIRYGKSV